jgi:FkbM family methyltransferase
VSALPRRVFRGLNSLLQPLGLELGRQRPTTMTVLARIERLGRRPATVIDVGAAYGDWAAECAAVFPSARYLLIEPLDEFAPFLSARADELGDARFLQLAAAGHDGEATLHVHPDLVGSSLLDEHDDSIEELDQRVVRAATLDSVVRETSCAGPFLVKLDTQGAELEVLAGAGGVLDDAVAVVSEVSFMPFFVGGHEVGDVVGAMQERGFVLYDVVEPLYRPLDGALAQADAVFVPDDSPLRSDRRFVDGAGRARQNAAFRRAYEERLLRIRD